ncbi:MAG: tripartite tricarboxylate transporter TctB family protein [Anderseniella sp.]|nr:tripartite tricarboxylate transporter TctB family protein [Anderseniella sp.]
MSEPSRPAARRPGEMIFCLLLAVFSVTAFWQSYAISGFTGLSEPGVFPMLASATMLVSSLVIMKDVLSKPATPEAGFARFRQEVVPLRLVGVILLILAYVVAMPLLGFVASSAGFLFLSFWYLWRKGPLVSAALTLASLAVIYFIFRQVFQVVLPQGSLMQGLF